MIVVGNAPYVLLRYASLPIGKESQAMASDIRALAETLREFALGMPGAQEDFPWGERVVKVGKKVFIFMGAKEGSEETLSCSVKLPRSAGEALQLPYAEPCGYGLGKHGWVAMKITSRDRAPLDLLMPWIEESYRAVAPKRLVAQLDGLAGATAAAKSKKRTK
jgi:predicted DNA-binding protein (MmcQ/YjbR family)